MVVSFQARKFSTAETDIEIEYQAEIADIIKAQEEKIKRRQSLVGVVVSDKMAKTINVRVARDKLIKKYQKVITVHRKFMAHDEHEVCDIGDIVRIVPSRPMSKRKRHKLHEVIRKADNMQDIEASAKETSKFEHPIFTL